MTKPKAKGAGKGARRPPRSAGPDEARPRGRETGEEAHLPWGRRNYLFLGTGGVALVVGFLLLALGDTTIAPILLVGGYLGLIPWGIVAARNGAGRSS
ncbi:MAG: hypothetical protein GF346_04905 [Candidatus Eisenbacteria bacterium]|nr:hypothetical protein [Candidatus Latescibacterota bacterium]MBD3301766.1 hypothetical protein [Candidatus Eisenbacteria bacterium]